MPPSIWDRLAPATRDFYRSALRALGDARVPFLVGGAYALGVHAGIERFTKDLDVFVRPADCEAALAALVAAGFRTERTFPHWLAKAYADGGADFVDVIYRSGNGIAEVDEAWFTHSVPGEVLGMPVGLCPAEETIWSKAWVMERERFDGADVAHLIRARGPELDWPRLLRRFAPHPRVLLSHLVLFGFIYPAERDTVPAWVLEDLIGRLRQELAAPPPAGRVCMGPLLSREQYLTDLERWGYRDGRLAPENPMTPRDVAHWTEAIDEAR